MQDLDMATTGTLTLATGANSREGGIPPTAAEVLQDLDQLVRRGESGTLVPLPSGFQLLDRYLDGGLRPGDLVLVGGAPGVGKTTLTLQMARNVVAQASGACVYVCYEHP